MKQLIRNYLYSSPPRAHYNILLNALGLNAIRTWIYNFQWKIKKQPDAANENIKIDNNEIIETLINDGVVVIDNFLPEDEFKELLGLYESTEMVDKHKDQPELLQYSSYQVSSPLKAYNERITEIISQNERLKYLIESTSRKKINVYPLMTLEKFYAETQEQVTGFSPGCADCLHYDVPLNSMRAFLYLKPCNEENAAFVYGKKTHLFNNARLKFEYYDSIKQSVKRNAIKEAPLDEIDHDLLNEIGYEPFPMRGGANSLVIFNTMGMHRRGGFQKTGAREALLIDFRTLDTPLNFWMGVPVVKDLLKAAAKKLS